MSLITFKDKQFKPHISSDKIEEAVKGIARKMNAELKHEFPVFLVVLNGAFMFAADLLKEITIESEISFVKVSSYSGTKSTGEVTELIGLTEQVNDRTVVVIEDIVDSGVTIERITNELERKKVKKCIIATALFKPASYTKSIKIDFKGFEVPNDFVVGYGMDYEGLGRNLKDIYILAN